ncbi:MAG: PQQ-binding-like beta-propeller repeat protein [Polyangiales bacterium]
MDPRWYSPLALRCSPQLLLALLVLLVLAACSGARSRPSAPCMSDAECRAERICHEGRCRFVEEVLTELATPVVGPDLTESDAAPRSANGFMGDAAHTGRSENRGPSASPTPAWTYQTGARVFASPVVGNDGTVYVGSLDGQFVALNADGSLKWRYAAGQKIYPSALIAGSSIIFGTHQRELVSLSLQGQPRWKLPLQDVVDASATLGPDGRVYVVANGAYAVDLLGRLHWHKPTADHVRSAPVIHPARLVIIGTTEGSLVALRPDGSVAWSVQLRGAIEGAASVDDEGYIYTGTGRGEIVQVDQTGTVRWRFKTGDEVRATPAIARDGTIIVGSYDGSVYAITPSGGLRWKVATGGRVRASARIDADGRIYVGSQDNFLYCIDPSGSVLWRYNVGQDVDSTVEIGSDGTLYFGSDDGGVHALR